MDNNKIIVAVDGYSSCGKSTMAKALAREVGYIYVDTGAMYRGVALAAQRAGLITADSIDLEGLESLLDNLRIGFRLNAQGLPELYLGDECVEPLIRSMEIASLASRVAALPLVRTAMTREQQRMGLDKGIVMDGRDIGTVVFPDAELKVFVTAQPRIRAERRLLELQAKGDTSLSLEEVLSSIEARDYADTHRDVAPLRQAEDALVLDNSFLTPDQQLAKLKEMFAEAISSKQSIQ